MSNQATVIYDADGNGTNETTVQSDDPAAGGSNDPTVFAVGAAATAAIPTASGLGLLLMALGIAVAAWKIMRT